MEFLTGGLEGGLCCHFRIDLSPSLVFVLALVGSVPSPGQRFLVFWFLVSESWFLVLGFCSLVSGFWFLVSGFWHLVSVILRPHWSCMYEGISEWTNGRTDEMKRKEGRGVD